MTTADSTPSLGSVLTTLNELTDQVALLSKVILAGSEGPDRHEIELTPSDAWVAGCMLSRIATKQRRVIDLVEQLTGVDAA